VFNACSKKKKEKRKKKKIMLRCSKKEPKNTQQRFVFRSHSPQKRKEKEK